jgi:hypothetical protein
MNSSKTLQAVPRGREVKGGVTEDKIADLEGLISSRLTAARNDGESSMN